MPNPAVMEVDRHTRRRLLETERRARASGEWGAWERIDLPNGTGSRGWGGDVRIAHRCVPFAVLERLHVSGALHLAVSSLSGERPTWWEMQRIKNDLAGEHRTAVEVYPPASEVVDEADMFHIWVLPEALPFSLKDSPDAAA